MPLRKDFGITDLDEDMRGDIAAGFAHLTSLDVFNGEVEVSLDFWFTLLDAADEEALTMPDHIAEEYRKLIKTATATYTYRKDYCIEKIEAAVTNNEFDRYPDTCSTYTCERPIPWDYVSEELVKALQPSGDYSDATVVAVQILPKPLASV